MPWTDPFSAIPGQLMTAALWNIQVRDNLNLLKTSVANDGRINGEIVTYREAVGALAIGGGVVAVDLALAAVFSLSLTANVTGWTFANLPPAGKARTVSIRLTQDATGGRTVAFPGTWRWTSGVVAPITATANKTDVVVLYTDDGWSTVYAAMYTQNA